MGLALIAYVESGSDEWGVQSKYYWKRFTSSNYSYGQYAPYLELTYALPVAPQVNWQYPQSGYTATTLTPSLVADATDPDNFPHPITYNFLVYDKDSGNLVVQSNPISSRSWLVPPGALTWGKTYFWTVVASDGLSTSSSQTMNVLSTAPPQPLVTSALAQNGGHGFSPGAGNYTTETTDASVATVGPALNVHRSYNSRDPRLTTAFGAGWSSLFDSRVTERTDIRGNLEAAVVTYPTGQEVGFGRNADGTFAPPPGRFATLTKVGSTGYTLVDKDGTTYTFTGGSGTFRLTSVADAQGRTQTFTLDAANRPVTATSASGRALSLTWSTPAGASAPHVTAVTTDPVTPGDPTTATTWTYGYTADLLTKVCPPTSSTACTTYTYTDNTQYPGSVLNAFPRSYWRLGDASGTVATSSVIENAGVDNATYANVTLGQPGPLGGSMANAAGFNGTNSSLVLPKTLLTSGSYSTVLMWFRTSAAGGILLAEGNEPLNSSTAPTHAGTPLYVGTDGKLHAGWYTGSYNQIVSTQTVNDGRWHDVVLTASGDTQWLYLDGSSVGSLSGTIDHLDQQYASVGAGYSSGQWASQPPQGWRFFNGSLAEIAMFDRPLSGTDVSALHAAGAGAAHSLASVVRPSGNASAAVEYNRSNGTVSRVTDGNGGVWQLPDPTISGSYQVHASSVLAAGPADYWRLAETGATQAINQVNGNVATYSGVTLGTPGGPFDDPATPADDTTVASFNGTSAYLQLPSADIPHAAAMSVGMWFKTQAGSTSGGVLFGYSKKSITDPTAGQGPWNDPSVVEIYFADLNGDSRQEVIKRTTDGVLTAYPNTGGLGAVTFGDPIVIGSGWNGPEVAGVFFADLNGDGKAELIRRNTNGNLDAWPNLNIIGGGSWDTPRTIGSGWNAPEVAGVFFADLNGDGKAELIRRSTAGYLDAWPNLNIIGGGSWDSPRTIGSGWNNSSIVGVFFSDLNADGKADLMARWSNGDVWAWPNADIIAGGSWGSYRTIGSGWNSSTVSGMDFSDVDGDRKAEFIKRASSGDLTAFLNVDGINFNWGNERTIQGGWTGAGVPALYVGTDGKLHGGLWVNRVINMASTGQVNDGNWHHVVLSATSSSQTLYVDGVTVATQTGALVDLGATYAYVGAGPTDGGWVSRPGNALGYFAGQVAEVSYYRQSLTKDQVGAQFDARIKSSGGLVKTVAVIDPGNQPVTTVFDGVNGRKIADIDALGNKTQYGYDVGGFLYRVIDPNGNVTTTEQDVRGNTVSSVTCQDYSASACSTVYYTYFPDDQTKNPSADARNDVVLTMRDGRSSSSADNTYKTSYAYDAWGNRTTVTDPLLRTTSTTYSTSSTPAFEGGGAVTKPGLPLTVTTPGGAVQTIAYYANGDIARVTDPAGKVTTFTYDGLGRVLTRTGATSAFPGGLTTTFAYDGQGRVISETGPAVTNRVTGAVHTAVTTTAYDADGFTLSKTVTDTTGGDAPRTASWTYSNQGLQATATDTAGKTRSFAYDAYGHVVRETDPTGRVVETTYDAKGQLLTSTLKNYSGDPNNPTAPADLLLTTKAYDPAGRLAWVKDAMGWKTLYTYTDNNLVATVIRQDPATSATFVQQQSQYDAAGNLIRSVGNNGATVTTYLIDKAGQTTSSTLDPGGLNRLTTQTISPDGFVLNTTLSDGTGVLSSTDTIYDLMGRPLATARASTTGLAPVGRWRLNETSGTTAADSAGNSPATATGPVTWSPEMGAPPISMPPPRRPCARRARLSIPHAPSRCRPGSSSRASQPATSMPCRRRVPGAAASCSASTAQRTAGG